MWRPRRSSGWRENAGQRLGVGEDGVLTRVHGGLRAGQVCGVVAAGGRTLEILPKIDGEDGGVRRALLRMLAMAHELPVELGALAPLERQREDLLEVLIRRFAERLLGPVTAKLCDLAIWAQRQRPSNLTPAVRV